MIDKIKAEYIKNPNRSYYLVWFSTPFLYLIGILISTPIYTYTSFWGGWLYLLTTLGFMGAYLINSYAILKIKNRSMIWAIFTYGIFSLMLPCLKKHPIEKEKVEKSEELKKQKVNYNVNGICTLNNKPCEMVKDLGICNCEICKLNPNKKG